MVKKETLPLERHKLGHPHVEVHRQIRVRRRLVHELCEFDRGVTHVVTIREKFLHFGSGGVNGKGGFRVSDQLECGEDSAETFLVDTERNRDVS